VNGAFGVKDQENWVQSLDSVLPNLRIFFWPIACVVKV
jgi:hypothetical protein